MPVATDEQTLRAQMTDRGIPDYMHDGLALYILHGYIPGDFLTALLSNDFFKAARHADTNNFQALQAYLMFLYNDAPSGCFGSEENVVAWHDQHGLLRDARR